MISSSDEFWRENINGRWCSLIVLLFLFLWHSLRHTRTTRSFTVSSSSTQIRVSASSATSVTPCSNTISNIITTADLTKFSNNLNGVFDDDDVKWDDVVDQKNISLSYTAKCYKPKNGCLTYMSTTIFENCSPELLRDFYMDNEYRVKWDKTSVEHKQLEIDESNGTEIGRTIKKFPLLTPREYVLAWRIWEGKDNTFYCFIKECEHSLAPLQKKKYVRVGYFRSGWRIRKVPGRNACEIKMVHQEDAGLNVEMAKLVFSKGIWSYVCKMDAALRKYTPVSHPQVKSAVTLMQKVPPEVEAAAIVRHHSSVAMLTGTLSRQEKKISEKTLSRRPSKRMIANGLLLLGGFFCISRAHSNIGTKIAIACILKKLTNNKAASGQAGTLA